jgi:recF protein
LIVDKIALSNFRNYKTASLIPSKGTTVLYGQNGVGKTNIVEAVHLCALGRSHRLQKDADLVCRGENSAKASVKATRRDGSHEVIIKLCPKELRKKQILLNGKPPKRLGEMMGHVTCVIFSPEDLELIKEGPSCRRRFMDMLLCQQSAAYFYELQKYNAALSQRNAILKTLFGNENHSSVAMLPIWDEQLLKAGAAIIKRRMKFIGDLEPLVHENYQYLSGSARESFKIRYRTCVEENRDIEEMLFEGLNRSRREDIKRGTSNFGPHRDDIIMNLSGKDMRSFASQGQIRTAALALKLSEIKLLTEQMDEAPILLLDDVMSELDMQRRGLLLNYISGIQAIVTCTDESDFPKERTDMRVHVSLDKEGNGILK